MHRDKVAKRRTENLDYLDIHKFVYSLNIMRKKYIKRISILYCLIIFFYSLTIAQKKEPIIFTIKQLIQNNKIKEAKKKLLRLEKITKDKNRLAEVYILLGDIESDYLKAKKYYQKVIKLQPSNSEFLDRANLNTGKLYFLHSDYDKASVYFSNALAKEEHKSNPDALYWLAETYYMQRKYHKAIKYFTLYVEVGKDTVKLEMSILGICNSYYSLERYNLASANFKELIASGFNNNFRDLSLYGLGNCYEKLEKYSLAVDYYKRVIKEYPFSNIRYKAEDRLLAIYNKDKELVDYKEILADISYDFDDYSTKKDVYSIQLAAFIKIENAQQCKKKFEAKGWNPYIFHKVVKNKKYYAVALGPYSTKEEADISIKKLKKQSIDYMLIKH